MEQYDVVVIGTGTAGQTAALDLVAEGYEVAIVEQSAAPGGVCALYGCQAKKWFYEVTELAARSSHLLEKGVGMPQQTDWGQILAAKNSFTQKVPENTVKNLRGNGVSWFSGQAVFRDASTLTVGETVIQARYFVIATGARPLSLPFAGADLLRTSNDFLDLAALPERIAFIGGGFISFEFAHFSARLGARSGQVHILEARNRPLAPFDADMVGELVAASEAEGIRVHTGVTIEAIQTSGGGYAVQLASGETLEVDLVVNGAGRMANIEALNLEAAGVASDKGGITVNSRMRTSQHTIFAVGDCASTLQLARVADREAQVAVRAIVADMEGGEAAEMSYAAVPSLLFTYPQLGMVGKTEEQLQLEKIPYRKSFDTSLSWPTYRRVGLRHAAYKILVDNQNRILGAHFLSDNAAGLLSICRQAMLHDQSADRLAEEMVMSPYPSRESDLIYMLAPFREE